MEKVIKPNISFVDYNTIKANPTNYILLGYSSGKCVCTIGCHEDEWYAYFSSDREDYDWNDSFEELIDDLHKKYKNFELMCERVEQL